MNTTFIPFTQFRQSARAFWQAWQAELARLQTLEPVPFVQESNAILHRHLPNIHVELAGEVADSDSTLVFTAEGVREHFPAVLAAVDAAPSTLPYRLQAFRSAAQHADENFGFATGDFRLNAADMLVRLDVWREMPALQIAFTKTIDEALLPHAKNMAFIILDHLIGEWNGSTKIGAADFVTQADKDFFPITQLGERLAALWQSLGRTGCYPAPEYQYAVGEATDKETERPIIFTRNQSANTLLGRADMGWIVHVVYEVQSQDDIDNSRALEDELTAHATQLQQGIDTLVVMHMGAGTRTLHYASAEPEQLVETAQKLAAKYPLSVRIDCHYDPTWSHYRT